MIGAGHNGLAAAIVLAHAGWKVTVLDKNAEPGGAAQTAEVTLPGFRHDLYATSIDSFLTSAFYARYRSDLISRGFHAVRAERAVGSAFPDKAFVGVSTDEEATLESIRMISAQDAEAWVTLQDKFWSLAPHILRILSQPMPSAATARTLIHARRQLGSTGFAELVRLAVDSSLEVGRTHFERRELHALFSAWGMHLDFPPEMPGGAFFPLLKTFGGARGGANLARGGVSNLVLALVTLLRDLGGEVIMRANVHRVLLKGDRAIGVETEDGSRFGARRAVIANVTPPALINQLLAGGKVDRRERARASGYRFGPGTLMMHLALDRAVPWAAGAHVSTYANVHVGPYAEDMSRAYSQAMSGFLPDRPTLVIGQPTSSDPSRAPQGKHILWVEARVMPKHIRGDAAAEITASDWDEAKEQVGDRILALLEDYAPGLCSSILGSHVISPTDLERANPNLVGGDNGAGSHHLAQNFFLRPLPGWSRYRTPVKRLYLCGAATWPGAGLGAGSGYLLAMKLSQRRFPKGPAWSRQGST